MSNQLARYNKLLVLMGMRRKAGGNGSNQHGRNPATVAGLQTSKEIASERNVSERTVQNQQRISTIVPEAQQIMFPLLEANVHWNAHLTIDTAVSQISVLKAAAKQEEPEAVAEIRI